MDNHSQSDKRDTGAYMHDGSENRDSPSILCTFLVLDCQRPEWSAVRPQCIDFCCHILSLLESHCQLVSRSPLIRLDVGAEFKACSRMSSVDGAAVVAAAESSLIAIQQRPEQWQRSGAGFIVRFFLKKVRGHQRRDTCNSKAVALRHMFYLPLCFMCVCVCASG